LPALLALAVIPFDKRGLWPRILVIIILGLLPLVAVMYIWGGIVPPSASAIVVQGYSFINLFSAIGYAGILTLILSPKWFGRNWRIFCLAVTIAIIGSIFRWNLIVPMKAVASRLLPEAFIPIYARIASGFILFFSMLMLFGFILRAWQKRKDKIYLYFIIATIGILITTMKITLYSSRYTIMIAPLLLLVTGPYIKFNKFLVLRIFLGGLLGVASLVSYLFFRS